ncbi:MAG: hypothetical protein PCFJNLEI_02062 [Verrucomicrobiae bacterium]|nr:hypothetical protein [Verrucomicrobiae bacterium]
MTASVKLILPIERQAACEGQTILIPAGNELHGKLTLQPSDGPHGIREYEHPHYVQASFEFELEGQRFQYNGLITQWDLWARNGTQVDTSRSDFRDDIGQIDGMMDDRDDWFYVLPDGRTHSNRLKYTSCNFRVMLQPTSLLVRCQYYDQNPDVTGMVTIYYTRPLEDLLLLKDTKFSYDANGALEDFSLRDGATITLQALRASKSVQAAGEDARA